MSRLYIKTENDISKTGKRANYKAAARIYWGSASDSKLAGSVYVHWPKDQEKPTVEFCKGDNLNDTN